MTTYPYDGEFCICQNCRKAWAETDLDPIEHLEERVAPGERMPAGQCPDCDAVCHYDYKAIEAAAEAMFLTLPTTWFYACPECHSTQIQQTAWIYMNTGENTGDEGPSDTIWCPDCAEEMGDGEINCRSIIEINGDRTLMRGPDGKEKPYVGPSGNV